MKRSQTLKMECFKAIGELRRAMLRAQKLNISCLTELTFALNKFAAFYEANKGNPKIMDKVGHGMPKKMMF